MLAAPCESPPQLLTAGRIADVLGVPSHRVTYLLDSRPDLRPFAYAGRTRLYRHWHIARLRHELTAMDARRACRASRKEAYA